jgi:hypothetical protein
MSSTCRSAICVANSTRPAADLLQKRPDIALVEVDAEPLGDDALEIDAPPTHDAVFLALGASLDDLRKRAICSYDRARLRAFHPVIKKPLRTRGVEAVNPVVKRPPVHAADPRGRPSVHSVSNPANDRSCRLWLTSFDRRASLRSSPAE